MAVDKNIHYVKYIIFRYICFPLEKYLEHVHGSLAYMLYSNILRRFKCHWKSLKMGESENPRMVSLEISRSCKLCCSRLQFGVCWGIPYYNDFSITWSFSYLGTLEETSPAALRCSASTRVFPTPLLSLSTLTSTHFKTLCHSYSAPAKMSRDRDNLLTEHLLVSVLLLGSNRRFSVQFVFFDTLCRRLKWPI